jgi:hypothetical protein
MEVSPEDLSHEQVKSLLSSIIKKLKFQQFGDIAEDSFQGRILSLIRRDQKFDNYESFERYMTIGVRNDIYQRQKRYMEKKFIPLHDLLSFYEEDEGSMLLHYSIKDELVDTTLMDIETIEDLENTNNPDLYHERYTEVCKSIEERRIERAEPRKEMYIQNLLNMA